MTKQEIELIKSLEDKIAEIEKQLPDPMVEIARSFSYKLNVGNYESRDFFCSQKAECKLSEAEKVSEALYQFCKKEVIKSVNDFKIGDKINAKDNAKQTAELEAE